MTERFQEFRWSLLQGTVLKQIKRPGFLLEGMLDEIQGKQAQVFFAPGNPKLFGWGIEKGQGGVIT